MKRSDFAIGRKFWCGGKRWRCTDVGTRVIVAICLEPHEIATSSPGSGEVGSVTDDPKWLNGPPYAVAESVFDEHDIQGCSIAADAEVS